MDNPNAAAQAPCSTPKLLLSSPVVGWRSVPVSAVVAVGVAEHHRAVDVLVLPSISVQRGRCCGGSSVVPVNLAGGGDASTQHAWCCILCRSPRARELQRSTAQRAWRSCSATCDVVLGGGPRRRRSCSAAFMVLRPSHRRRTAELQCSASCCDRWTSPATGSCSAADLIGAAELHCDTLCCDRWTSPAAGATVQHIAGVAELQCNALCCIRQASPAAGAVVQRTSPATGAAVQRTATTVAMTRGN